MRVSAVFIFLYLNLGCNGLLTAQAQHMKTGVLVIGGSTGGTAAGIQAARMGIQVIIAEPTTLLGGMLTAAGVSCTDGNDALASGIWQAFREALYRHYHTRNLATGWVSQTCFEPHVGDSIFKAWVAKETNIQVCYGYHLLRIIKKGKRVQGAVFLDANQRPVIIRARITIDATELGDGLAKAGAAYDLGMDDAMSSKEQAAADKNNIIQDITWAAVLKDFGTGADKTIAMPADYKATHYDCCCTDAPCSGQAYKVNAQKMLDYARLPGNKYMLNWPAHGNDSYLNVVEENDTIRNAGYTAAKNRTLGFIYFIQTQLGMKNLGLAADELDSGMALIPYNREGRRLKGTVRLNSNHISNPYAYTLYRTGISVGDYPVDHHHGQYPGPLPVIHFPKIPSFNIPLGTLIPATTDGLLVCEKGISVSNIVNGSTRLQPVVLLTGQAAGVIAALSVKNNIPVRQVPVRSVQQQLLDLKCYIMPYADVPPEDPCWEATQKAGATGIFRGVGISEGWANKTYFYPDSTALFAEFKTGLNKLGLDFRITRPPGAALTYEDLLSVYAFLVAAKKIVPLDKIEAKGMKAYLLKYHFQDLLPNRPLTRKEAAVLVDHYLHVFTRFNVDIHGKIIGRSPAGK